MCFFMFGILLALTTSGQAAGQPSYDTEIVVAQDGSGDYTRIQDAIDNAKSFPDQHITIRVRKGVYREKVVVHAWNTRLSLVGQSRDSTIITWDDHFAKIGRGRNSTFMTYTLLVQGDLCRLENLTIRNTAGPVGQAIALSMEADRCVVRNCAILGDQDALYVAGSRARQYFSDCLIEGTTDFIFGPATAVFDQCEIHSKSNSFITAASTPEGVPFGLVFIACTLTAKDGVDAVYLGRPWRDHARVAFLACTMGAHIKPAGWHNWDNPAREATVTFCEYDNSGPGADTSHRVMWSCQLAAGETLHYRKENVLADEAGRLWWE